MIKRTILFFCFYFISFYLNAQSFEKTCQHLRDDHAGAILKTSDDHILVAGSTTDGIEDRLLLMKTDMTGKIEWLKSIKADSSRLFRAQVFECYDGNYLISGAGIDTTINGHSNFILIKVDTACNIIWKKHYNSNSKWYEKVIQTKDTGFILLASSYGSNMLLLTKMDQNGDVLWAKEFSDGAIITSAGFDIVETPAGDLIICGILICPVSCDYRIKMKLDKDGNVIWTKDISRGGSDLLAVSGNYYYIKSQFSPYEGLIKMDTAGNVIWAKSLYSQSFPFAIYDIEGDHLTGVFFTGRISTPNENGFIGHCDSAGVVDVFKIYNNTEQQAFTDLFVGDTYQLLLAGYTRSPAPDSIDIYYASDDLMTLNCSFIYPAMAVTTVLLSVTNYPPLTVQSVILNTLDDSLTVFTDTVFVEIDNCQVPAQTKEIKNESGLKIYPNPAVNSITIECNDDYDHELIISNIFSQVIMKTEIQGRVNRLNIESLLPGIYTVKDLTSMKPVYKTFIKVY